MLAAALTISGWMGAATAQAEQLPKELEGVGITEHLGDSVDLNLTFADHTGKMVALRELVRGDIPVLLTLNYYGCPMLCGIQLNFLREALAELDWVPGKQFRIITVSFDPRERSSLAAKKREAHLQALGKGDVDWQFLTGSAESIKALTSQMGYNYHFVESSQEFAHPAAIMFLSPTGLVSRYIYGLNYYPRDLKFALIEASAGRVGSSVDKIIMSCFHYDPAKGSYVPFAWGVMRLGAAFAVLALGSMIFVLRRREKLSAVPSV